MIKYVMAAVAGVAMAAAYKYHTTEVAAALQIGQRQGAQQVIKIIDQNFECFEKRNVNETSDISI